MLDIQSKIMFWCDILTEDTKYCTCQGGWYNFKIIPSHIEGRSLKIFLTPEGGAQCLLEEYFRGHRVINKEFLSLSPWQHVKIHVIGGEILLLGKSEESVRKLQASSHFYPGCVFADVEFWGDRERLMIEEDDVFKCKELHHIMQSCRILRDDSSKVATQRHPSGILLEEHDLLKIGAEAHSLMDRIAKKLIERGIIEEQVGLYNHDGVIDESLDDKPNRDALLIIRYIENIVRCIKKYFSKIGENDDVILSSRESLDLIIKRLNQLISRR